MGYIKQSDNKKIYAYLTQLGKERFITGELEDFQIKYFSLHDDDINYYIASKNISAATYNIPKSGFISDVTGDDDICLSNVSDATLLKNKLIYFPPIVVPPGEFAVFTSCTDTIGNERFSITVYKDPAPQGYSWFVTIDTISFPNSDSTIDDVIIISTEDSEKYPLNSNPVSFNASMKRTVSDGSGGFTTVLLGEDFFPRAGDAYNFTVKVVNDNTDEIVFTKEFKDINCSKKLFAIGVIHPDDLAASDNSDYTYNSPMPVEDFIPLLPDIKLSRTKTGIALWVIDNGNRRRDLNFTQEDLDKDLTVNRSFNNFFLDLNTQYGNSLGYTYFPQAAGPAQILTVGSLSQSAISIDWFDNNTNDYYPNISADRAITRPSFIRFDLNDQSDWWNGGYSPGTTYDDAYQAVRPQNYNGNSFTEKFCTLHPTVKIFNDWKNGAEGFTFRYYEIALRAENYPLQSYVSTIPKKAGTTYNHFLATNGIGPSETRIVGNTYGGTDIGSDLVNGTYQNVGESTAVFEFSYCVNLVGNYLCCFWPQPC